MSLTMDDLKTHVCPQHFAADGKELRRARARAGLTQTQIAQIVGVATSTVCRWESSQTIPSDSNARQVADVVRTLEMCPDEPRAPLGMAVLVDEPGFLASVASLAMRQVLEAVNDRDDLEDLAAELKS
jgi:transcriptional regulator with XRE-family HTH domain